MQVTKEIQPTERIFVRVPQALEITGMGRSKFYELLQSGEIKSISLGGKARLVSVRSIHEWANRQLLEQEERGMLSVKDRT